MKQAIGFIAAITLLFATTGYAQESKVDEDIVTQEMLETMSDVTSSEVVTRAAPAGVVTGCVTRIGILPTNAETLPSPSSMEEFYYKLKYRWGGYYFYVGDTMFGLISNSVILGQTWKHQNIMLLETQKSVIELLQSAAEAGVKVHVSYDPPTKKATNIVVLYDQKSCT